MPHDAHIVDFDAYESLAREIRAAGFPWEGDSPRRPPGPRALLRVHGLAGPAAGSIRRAAQCRDLGPAFLGPDPLSRRHQRLLMPGSRPGWVALAEALRPCEPRLAAELDRLLSNDASREWVWRLGDRTIRPGPHTLVMGVVNVTPDSFFDGGRHLDPGRAVEHGLRLVQAGAHLVDVGGESSRPGSRRVAAREERDRVVPVIRSLSRQTRVPLSVDTTRAEVAEEALAAGARAVNDISGLKLDPGLAGVAARSGAGLVLMHMRGTPRTMQRRPSYRDVLAEVLRFLRGALERALQAGVGADQVAVDPGVGFGKRLEHNLTLLRHAGALRALGRPILVGVSRKSFLGEITGQPANGRLAGSLAAAAAAAAAGVSVVRAHDVAETVDLVRVLDAVRAGNGQ